MYQKYVNLFVQSNNFPFRLEVLSAKGMVVAQKQILTPFSQNCLITCQKSFYLRATFGTLSISRFVTLSCAKCQSLYAKFNFLSPVPLQTFTLIDATYSFPIPSATLTFTS